ncbi:RAD51-associated protein 2 [Mastomys coucha]|uniref:RAD51-associated protein 2 n=1 Tax=Mastomys coucha TaxID=35658 RepID=UPI0012623C4D|nr:RAD51-associated protein 2 [Mastomys coucha]
MALSRPAWPAGPAWPVSSEPRPEDPAAASPSSKRRRLNEPDGIFEAGWPLLVVPRLSEVEKAWEWSLRPFTAFLIPKNLGSLGCGRQPCDLGCHDRTFQTHSCWQSGIFRRAGCSRAPRRSCEAGLRGREAQGVRLGGQAEVSHAPSNAPMPYGQGVKRVPEELPEKETVLKEKNSVRQPGDACLGVTFSEETKSSSHESKDRCKADSVITSEKKENVSSCTLKISKFQNQACLETAKLSYFRDSITKNFPEFLRDLNSNMSFVYLKEIAKEKNDKIVAYVRDFTNIFLFQNRPDAKKQKLQDDKKNLSVEIDFSDYSESNHQSLIIEGKIDFINLNYYRHSSAECDVRDSKKNFTLTLEDANWEGTERNQDYYIPTRQESQSLDYNRSSVKIKKQNCWTMKKIRITCENMSKHREHLNLARLLLTDLLHKGDYPSVEVRDVRIGTLGSSPNLIIVLMIKVVWFNDKGENVNVLQLGYYTIQKYISANKEDSTLICHKISTCIKQIDIQKSGILSKYSQDSISEFLNMILKTNIVTLLDNFDSFIRNGDDGESESGIFKYIVNLNYLKNIKDRHIVYLTKMLTSSRLLEHNTKSTAKKRKLFKMEHILQWAKKQNINSITTTTKSFLIYKLCEIVSLLMDFNNMEELSLTKEPRYENTRCAEQLLNMENLDYYSFGIGDTHVKSDPLFTQNNCGHINEKYYESSMYNQDLDTERKWKHKLFKFIFEDALSVRQLCTLLSQNISHSDLISAMAITLKISLENLLSEIEEKIYDFVLKKEMKVPKGSNSCQAHKAVDTEKEESFPTVDRMSSVQSTSILRKRINVEETKSVNQNNRTSTKEDGGILQESELANSKHFHPKNESALNANHQFESDSSKENNECFQGLTAKCLSTETLPGVKDFEMKSEFDLVLEELRMFHEISKENEIPSTMETNNRKENYSGESNDNKEARMEIGKKLEMAETNTRVAPFLSSDVQAGLNKHKGYQSLFNWKTISTHGGQAVPNECWPRSEEGLLHSTPEEDHKKPLPKSPTFLPDECKNETLLKGGSHFSNGISRVQPLKTCSRPIRVGLSRRARLKQLHPYLK